MKGVEPVVQFHLIWANLSQQKAHELGLGFIAVLDQWIGQIDRSWQDDMISPETREKMRIEKITYEKIRLFFEELIRPPQEAENEEEED